MKSLVAYYSRTNITKKLAEDIAKNAGADIEEIKPKNDYDGKLGYVRAGKDAISEKIIDLQDLKYDPADYDMVYIGTPVWVSKAANPIISYMKINEGKLNNVKFFTTAGSSGFESTFEQMEKYSSKPVKKIGLTTKEVKKGEYSLEGFTD
ncbi:flavodoxin [Methanobrevibacter sp.]